MVQFALSMMKVRGSDEKEMARSSIHRYYHGSKYTHCPCWTQPM